MDCLTTICLYLKKYISDDEFEYVFYKYIEDFQKYLTDDVYVEILSTKFSSKQDIISLKTVLLDYVLDKNNFVYDNINDAHIEKLMESPKEDVLIEILKKKYEKRSEVNIDCSIINTRFELINIIKQELNYPEFCGDNWSAIDDLIYDIIFPQKLVLNNWYQVEKKLPHDTAVLKSILDKVNEMRCVVIYA